MKHILRRFLCTALLIACIISLFPAASVSVNAASTIPSEYDGIATLHQLPCQYYATTFGDEQNMSYVIMTSGGKLIVIDGGYRINDPEYLLNYLKMLSGSDKPSVEAWFITHAHADHVGAFRAIAANYSDQITVEAVYHRLPTAKEIDTYFYNDDPTDLKTKVQQVHDACALLKTRAGSTTPMISCTPAYKANAGEYGTFTFDDVYIEILMTCKEVFWFHDNCADESYSGTWANNNASFSSKTYPYLVSCDFNNSSMVFRAHIGGKSILFMGDTSHASGIALGKCHDRYLKDGTRFNLKSDIVQVAHHGVGKFPKDIYSRIDPDVCLWPTYSAAYNGPAETKHSAYHTRQWLSSRRSILSYDGPQVLKFGAESLLFDFNTDADAVSRYYNSAYGMYDFSSTAYWTKGADMKTATISGGKLVLTTTTLANYTGKKYEYIETSTARSTDRTHPLKFTPDSGDVVMIRYKVNSYDSTTNQDKFATAPTICLYAFDNGTETYQNTSQVTVDTSGNWVVQKWAVPTDWLSYNISNIHLKLRYFLNSKITIDYIYVGPNQSDRLFFDFTDTAADLSRYENIVYGDYNYDNSKHWATLSTGETTISNGTMKLAISDSANATAIEPSDSPANFGYADKRNENAFVLNYSPASAEILQVRMKLTGVVGQSPELFFDYYGDNDSAWASGMTGSNRELIRIPIEQACTAGGAMEGEYVLFTASLKDTKFVKKGNINAIRFDIYGANSGTAEIDYIYVGPLSGAKSYTVTYLAEDGSTLQEVSTQTGAAPYSGAVPTKTPTKEVHYEFAGWKDASGKTVRTDLVAADITVYPDFTAVAHTCTSEEDKLPTCTEAGYCAARICSACGYVVTEASVLEALGHNYEAVSTTAPTCTDGGYTTYTCSLCGDSYVGDKTPATGHVNTSTVTTDATCTEDGSIVVTCACGEVVSTKIVAALGHSYEASITAPTCTEAGYTTYICSLCGNSYVGDETPATGHVNTSTVTTDATCTEDGSIVVTCACGEVVSTEIVAALGHIEVIDAAVAGNCVTPGLTEGKRCQRCGEVLIAQEVVPAKEHNLSYVNIKYATCTKDGCTHHYRCENCGKYFADEVAEIELPEDYLIIEATGHTETVTAAVAATCTDTGLTEGKHCAVCGEVLLAQEEIATLGHSYDVVVTNPTCTAAGYTTYTCSVCGDCYISDEVAALGHSYDAEVTIPTCTVAGSVTMSCDDCGDTLYTESIPAMGHSFEYINDGDDHRVVCRNRCDYTDDSANCEKGCNYTASEAHSYADGICICGAVEVTEPIVDSSLTFGAQLYLENDLTMAFRVKADKLAAYDISTAYLVVERDIYESGASEAFVETTVISDCKLSDDGRYVFSYPGIAAAQMNDAIRATLYIKDADDKEFVSPVVHTSVATYLDGLLTNSASNTELATLIMDMVNYGTAAQVYFDRHADAPVNGAFESFKTYASYASSDFKTALENLSATENAEGKSGKLNLGLDLGTRIGIQYKVTVPAGVNVEDVTLVVADASGNELETLQVAGNPTDDRGRYIVNFYGATAKDMRRVVYATAYANGEAITGTYAYSISTYAWGIQENAASQPADLVNVTRAMMLYGDSAANYFS